MFRHPDREEFGRIQFFVLFAFVLIWQSRNADSGANVAIIGATRGFHRNVRILHKPEAIVHAGDVGDVEAAKDFIEWTRGWRAPTVLVPGPLDAKFYTPTPQECECCVNISKCASHIQARACLEGPECCTRTGYLYARDRKMLKPGTVEPQDTNTDPKCTGGQWNQILNRTGAWWCSTQGCQGNALKMAEGSYLLVNSTAVIDGLRYFGSPWQSHRSWNAFYLPEDDLNVEWSRIPADVDVLITHTAPHFATLLNHSRTLFDPATAKMVDEHSNSTDVNGYKQGSVKLAEAVARVKPYIHIFLQRTVDFPIEPSKIDVVWSDPEKITPERRRTHFIRAQLEKDSPVIPLPKPEIRPFKWE